MEPDISSGGNENRHNERAPRNGRDRRSAKRKIVIRALDGGKDNAARHNDDDRHRPRKIAAEPDGQPIAAKKEHHKDRRAPRAGNDLPDLNRPLAEPLAPMLGVDTRQRSQRNDDRREDVIQKVRDRQGSGKIGDRTLGKFLPNNEGGNLNRPSHRDVIDKGQSAEGKESAKQTVFFQGKIDQFGRKTARTPAQTPRGNDQHDKSESNFKYNHNPQRSERLPDKLVKNQKQNDPQTDGCRSR